jgi:hypothetical protein
VTLVLTSPTTGDTQVRVLTEQGTAVPLLPVDVSSGGSPSGVGLYAARPPPGINGAQYRTTDGTITWIDDGTVWRPNLEGTLGTQVPLVASFANKYGAATFSDVAGSISGTGDAGQISSLCNGYAVGDILTCHVQIQQLNDSSNAGLVFRNTSDDSQMSMVYGNGGIEVHWWIDNGTFGTGFGGCPAADARWLRIQDDGAAFHYFFSSDGKTWTELTFTAHPDGGRSLLAAGSGPTQFGLALETSAGITAVWRSMATT